MAPRTNRQRASALPKSKLQSGRTKAVAAPCQVDTKVQSRKPKMQTSSRQPGMKLRSGKFKEEAKVEVTPRQHEMKLRSSVPLRGPIPQTHPITEKITASNLSSRLLQLPQELKNQIYSYVLGGKCIHVESACTSIPTRPFRLYPCRATATTASAQRLFNTATEIDPVQIVDRSYHEYETDEETEEETDNDAADKPNTTKFVCVDTHRRCYNSETPGITRSCMTTRRRRMPPIETLMQPSRTIQTAQQPLLSLRGELHGHPPFPMGIIPFYKEPISLPMHLLRTCRQIYHEMRPIIYSTNTFSFGNPNTLTQFASHDGSNPLAVRHLHLHITIYDEFDENRWTRALRAAVRRFRNLCSVDIGIDQALWNSDASRGSKRKNPSMTDENTFLTGLSELKKLKFLRELTIVVTDVYPWEAWERNEFLWSTAQKQKWVQGVKADILGGDKD